LSGEVYCHAYQHDGVVACDDCPYYKGYAYRIHKEGEGVNYGENKEVYKV